VGTGDAILERSIRQKVTWCCVFKKRKLSKNWQDCRKMSLGVSWGAALTNCFYKNYLSGMVIAGIPSE
jgi:hypothetical protein